MDGGGRFVGTVQSITFKQFRQAKFIEITLWAIAVRLDPIGVLDPQVIMNLELECG